MNTKVVAIAGGGVLTIILLAMFVRDSGDSVRITQQQTDREKLAAADETEADTRWGGRPKVFGKDTGGQRSDERGQKGFAGSERDESGGTKPHRFTGQGERGSDGGGSGRGEEVRDRLEDSSAPFEMTRGGAEGGGARRPMGDTRHGEPPGVDVVDAPVEPQDETQPVLSLFDGDTAYEAAEATVNKGVELDDDGARFTPDSEYAVPMAGKITGDTGSISFWVKPEGDTADRDVASLVQLRSHYKFNDRLQIWKDGASVRLVIADSNGVEGGALYSSEGWASDEWRLVTTTWRPGEAALYVNGELAGTLPVESLKMHNDTLLHVASNYPEDPPGLKGTVTEFRVYDYDLAPEEVAELPSEYPE